MNTFFRIAIYLSFAMIAFNLFIGYVGGLNVYPLEEIPGTGTVAESNALTTFTGLTGGMAGIWIVVTTLGGVTAFGLAILTRSLTPVGLYLFGEVFWTAYIKSHSVLSYGGYIATDFLVVFLVGMIFLFIAAIIGMLTGGG